MRILRDSFSTQDTSQWSPHGNGGTWRRHQTDGILRRHGVEPLDLESPPEVPMPVRVLRAFALKARFRGDIRWTRRSLGQAEYSDRFYSHNARRPGHAGVVLLESGADPVAIAALKRAGMRVIAVLSAINSLWRSRPNEITGPYPGMFLSETRDLATIDGVFCISREEQWLLNNLGIAARYLPYYPDPNRTKALMAERAARPPAVATAPREFMICASRGNSDTINAFREQAEWICRATDPGDALFHVTGQQTEEIREIWADSRFVFHGTCSDDEFQAVKQRCAALCLHQREGLGALTRIPDMLISGLSIVANGPAARSFVGTAGVNLYDTPGQFRGLLERPLPTPPVPDRPVELEDAFFATLQLP